MIPWDDEAGFHAALGDFLGASIPTLVEGGNHASQ